MRLFSIPIQTGLAHCFGEHGFAQRKGRQTNGIKGAEGMKGIVFEIFSCCGSEKKGKIKMGIVSDQHRATATLLPHLASQGAKEVTQGLTFWDGTAQGVVRVDAIEGQGTGIKNGIGKRLYVIVQGLYRLQRATLPGNHHRSNF